MSSSAVQTGQSSPADGTLVTRDITVRYGGVVANDAVSIVVRSGELVGLIGPNGAGKTTFIDAISGFTSSTGQVFVHGRDISKYPAHVRVREGIGRSFQTLELFEDMTVGENLRVAATRSRWYSPLVDIVRPTRDRDWDNECQTLARLGIEDAIDRYPRELSTGVRKLVAVARTVIGQPAVLLLDEPAAGLDTAESAQLGKRLRALVDHGQALLLVDHDLSLVLDICDRLYVLDFGRVIADGNPMDVMSEKRVISAYLGSKQR